MTDIFVSYAREDAARIQPLIAGLERRGWSVFWDRRIPAGETWRSYIGTALEEARCVLVAWSRDSTGSSWVSEEAEDAKQRGVLVPVLLDDVAPPRGFREIQTADLRRWTPGEASPEFDQLADDIGRLLARGRSKSPPDTPRTPPPASAPPRPGGRAGWPAIAGAVALGAALVAGLSMRGRERPVPAPVPPPPAAPERGPAPTSPPATAPAPVEPGSARAVINDPDGFTNVRSGPGAAFGVVTRIVEGEPFTTRVSPGDWWPVTTRQGVAGYVHRSRVRLVE